MTCYRPVSTPFLLLPPSLSHSSLRTFHHQSLSYSSAPNCSSPNAQSLLSVSSQTRTGRKRPLAAKGRVSRFPLSPGTSTQSTATNTIEPGVPGIGCACPPSSQHHKGPVKVPGPARAAWAGTSQLALAPSHLQRCRPPVVVLGHFPPPTPDSQAQGLDWTGQDWTRQTAAPPATTHHQAPSSASTPPLPSSHLHLFCFLFFVSASLLFLHSFFSPPSATARPDTNNWASLFLSRSSSFTPFYLPIQSSCSAIHSFSPALPQPWDEAATPRSP